MGDVVSEDIHHSSMAVVLDVGRLQLFFRLGLDRKRAAGGSARLLLLVAGEQRSSLEGEESNNPSNTNHNPSSPTSREFPITLIISISPVPLFLSIKYRRNVSLRRLGHLLNGRLMKLGGM